MRVDAELIQARCQGFEQGPAAGPAAELAQLQTKELSDFVAGNLECGRSVSASDLLFARLGARYEVERARLDPSVWADSDDRSLEAFSDDADRLVGSDFVADDMKRAVARWRIELGEFQIFKSQKAVRNSELAKYGKRLLADYSRLIVADDNAPDANADSEVAAAQMNYARLAYRWAGAVSPRPQAEIATALEYVAAAKKYYQAVAAQGGKPKLAADESLADLERIALGLNGLK